MTEWLVERGIGETRAALVQGGQIIEARILLDGTLAAGSVVECRLRSVGTGGRNAIAATQDATEILLPHRPAGVNEGAALQVEITREAITGVELWKRPLGRPTEAGSSQAALEGRALPFPPAGSDEFDQAGWPDLLDEARSGIVSFAGGELRLFVTPAMTLIDVDGSLPPAELAVAGAAAAGSVIRRLAIGGSIGIDLPTVQGKGPRQRAAGALDRSLEGTAFERTAVNGFGFLQIIRPRRHASFLELTQDRASFEARALLRQAAVGQHGPCTMAAHPVVVSVLEKHPEWLAELGRQRGGKVTLRADPTLSISGGHAEPS